MVVNSVQKSIILFKYQKLCGNTPLRVIKLVRLWLNNVFSGEKYGQNGKFGQPKPNQYRNKTDTQATLNKNIARISTTASHNMNYISQKNINFTAEIYDYGN